MLKIYTGQCSGILPFSQMDDSQKIFSSMLPVPVLSKGVSGQYFAVTCKLTFFFFFFSSM